MEGTGNAFLVECPFRLLCAASGASAFLSLCFYVLLT